MKYNQKKYVSSELSPRPLQDIFSSSEALDQDQLPKSEVGDILELDNNLSGCEADETLEIAQIVA